jgi:DNA polymerase III subunit alpha
MDKYKFSCGCTFDKTQSEQADRPLINFVPDISKINLECSLCWKLIGSGNTKGCFQLESRLGQMMAKKLKPENIEQLAALISILRPGCLEAFRDGKSVSNHYIDKKNGEESIDYYHESLEPILQGTYGEMIYQEQAMQITQTIAGFDLQEADMLRKAIGKKKPEEMAKIKKKFIKGCKKQNIVSADEAKEIFGWIEKSQRYSFNKSHAISYALNAYLSAYAKCHFPKIFFASYLRFAKDKIDPHQEIKELVRNALEMDIYVSNPDFRIQNRLFTIKNKTIYFGLTDIKGVGLSVFNKAQELISMYKDISLNNIFEVMFKVLSNININAAKALIMSGSFDYTKKTRTTMLLELETINILTKKEKAYIINNFDFSKNANFTLKKILEYLINEPNTKINKNRRAIINDSILNLENPPYSLQDKIEWLSDVEHELLGTSISCSKIDSYDISMTNSDCKMFKKDPPNKKIILAAEISDINIVKTKKGKNPGQEMAFITVQDQYGSIDSVVAFPEQFAMFRSNMIPGNVLVFMGQKNKNKDSLIVEKCFEPMS